MIDPITRGCIVPSESLTTSVYRQSWACSTSCIRRSPGSRPTPVMPQSSALPSSISRSTYIASWARWNPPTPKWTMPVVTCWRLYVGTATPACPRSASVEAVTFVIVAPLEPGLARSRHSIFARTSVAGRSMRVPWSGSRRRPDDGLHGVWVGARHGERLPHVVEAVVTGDEPVELDAPRRPERDGGGPGVCVPEGARHGQLSLLDPAHRQDHLVPTHPDENDVPGRLDDPDGVSGGRRLPRTLQQYVDPKIGLADRSRAHVEGSGDAELFGDRQPMCVDVGDRDRRRPDRQGGLRGHQTDRPGPRDQHPRAGAHAASAAGPQSHRQRLKQCRRVVTERVGD